MIYEFKNNEKESEIDDRARFCMWIPKVISFVNVLIRLKILLFFVLLFKL